MSQRKSWRAHLGAALIAVAALALLAPAASSAATRFAEPGGNGPAGVGGCLIADPCGLEAAVEDPAVVDGDTVLLLAGPYSLGAATQIVISDTLVVQPAPGVPRPRLDSTVSNTVLEVGSGAIGTVVRDIEISQTNTGSSAIGIRMQAAGSIVERIVVTTNGRRACATSEGLLRDSVCTLASSSINGLGALGTDVNGVGAHTISLRNVTAVSKKAGTPAIQLRAEGGSDLTIDARNVNADSLPGVFDAVAETDSAASTSATINFASSAYVLKNQTGTAASVNPAPGAGGNIAAEAQYSGFASNDFHQLATSPTVNRGTIDSLVGAFDFDGQARVQDTAPDIGADELPFLAAVPATPVTTPASPKAKRCKKAKKKKGRAAAKKKGCKKRKKKK